MKLLTSGLCVFFLAFATLRAVRVPLTYDEAASYIRYVDTSTPSVFDTSALSIFNFEVATNHFLNTLLTKLCDVVAGGSEIVLRLPSVIGYAMFLGFSLLILHRSVRPAIATPGFLLLNLNPYVLDFFSLSRGYGLSLGFLMGSLFYLFKFLDYPQQGDGAPRDVSRSLACALGAVMSNFAMLNVWLSLLIVLLAAIVLRNVIVGESWTTDPGPRIPDPGPRIPDPGSRIPAVMAAGTWRSFTAVFWLAALFAALVFSQDPGLSNTLYEPVRVGITGLDPGQRERASVVRVDLRGRDLRVPRDAGTNEWRWPDRVPYRGLRIELPVQDAGSVEHIDVLTGSRVFSFDPRRESGWSRHDRDTTRVFEPGASLSLPRSRIPRFQPVMNWAGDSRYAARIAARTAEALGILAVLALLLKAAGWLAARWNIVTAGQWRPLEMAILWVAALAGPPLYLLRRNGELYFGGTRGIVEDTFYSTIEGSFYGRIYHPAQIRIVFVAAVITVAMSGIVLFRHSRRQTMSIVVPLAAVLSIMVVTSLLLVVQHAVFQTVYLSGRTALFYIPLFSLFLTLLCEAIAAFGQAAKALAIALLASVVLCSAYHFAATANLRFARDWREDASTRMMIEDLEQVLEAEGAGRSHAVLGVESRYVPVAVYYAHRAPKAGIEIVSLPSSSETDFQYLEDTGHSPNVIRRYPLARSVLVRMRAP